VKGDWIPWHCEGHSNEIRKLKSFQTVRPISASHSAGVKAMTALFLLNGGSIQFAGHSSLARIVFGSTTTVKTRSVLLKGIGFSECSQNTLVCACGVLQPPFVLRYQFGLNIVVFPEPTLHLRFLDQIL
jgi:cell division ATPase FtsA